MDAKGWDISRRMIFLKRPIKTLPVIIKFIAQSSSEISTSFVVKGEEGKKTLEALQAEKEFADFFKITWEEISIINITGKKYWITSLKQKFSTL